MHWPQNSMRLFINTSTSSSTEMNLSRSCNSVRGQYVTHDIGQLTTYTLPWSTAWYLHRITVSMLHWIHMLVQLLQEFKCVIISTICHTWYDMLIMLYSIPFMMHFFGPSHLVIRLKLHLCHSSIDYDMWWIFIA